VTANAPSSRSSTDAPQRREGLWACGTLGRAHGLDGELYVDLLPHGLEYLSSGERFHLGDEGGGGVRPVRLRRSGGSDRRPLVRLEGVETRAAARALHGSVLLASAATLDEGGFYMVSELIGARALCGAESLGTVSDVLMAPAHDILEIAPDEGGEPRLVPLVAELVEVDRAAGVVRVREGLF